MPQEESGLRPPYLILALCVALVLAVAWGRFDFSFDDPTETGAVAAEVRNVAGDVRNVEIAGPIETVIRIGEAQSVEIEAAESLRPRVKTEVRQGTLRLSLEGRRHGDAHLRVNVTLPRIETLRIAGSGDAEVTGLNGGRFTLMIDGSGDVQARGTVERTDVTIRGSGDVDMSELATADPTVIIEGSGNVEIGNVTGGTARVETRGSGDVTLSGRAERLDVTVAGSGDIDAGELDTQNGRIEIRGSGDVEAHVQALLEVTHLSGNGVVTNHGAGRTVTTELGKKRN
jgi:hypothetical protein